MARMKVVSKLPGWPRLVSLLCLAVLVVLPAWTLPFSDDITYETYERFRELYGIGLLATMFLVLPVALSFSEQRPWRAVVESVLIASGAVITSGILLSVANHEWETLISFAERCAAASAAMTVIRLVALWGVRRFGRKLVLHAEHGCWTCGHNLTGNTSGTCPECGTPVADRRGQA